MSNSWTSPDSENSSNFGIPSQSSSGNTTEYAGFWLRFVAFVADSLIIGLFQTFVIMPVLGIFGYHVDFDPSYLETDESMRQQLGALLNYLVWVNSISFAVSWLYYAFLESSETQATLGKIMLGIKVTDTDGNRLDFTKATTRFFAKILSSITLFIGYLMAGFTEKKQALHDIVAGTLVIKKETGQTPTEFV